MFRRDVDELGSVFCAQDLKIIFHRALTEALFRQALVSVSLPSSLGKEDVLGVFVARK